MENETKENLEIEKCLRDGQILTGIDGLDKLFYEEGLQLPPNNKPLSVLIYGKSSVSKSLLAMQLLHGITKSIHRLCTPEYSEKLGSPIFVGGKNVENIEDMFLDYIISKSMSVSSETTLVETIALTISIDFILGVALK